MPRHGCTWALLSRSSSMFWRSWSHRTWRTMWEQPKMQPFPRWTIPCPRCVTKKSSNKNSTPYGIRTTLGGSEVQEHRSVLRQRHALFLGSGEAFSQDGALFLLTQNRRIASYYWQYRIYLNPKPSECQLFSQYGIICYQMFCIRSDYTWSLGLLISLHFQFTQSGKNGSFWVRCIIHRDLLSEECHQQYNACISTVACLFLQTTLKINVLGIKW